jgi:peptidoglycan-associated lipoprotein
MKHWLKLLTAAAMVVVVTGCKTPSDAPTTDTGATTGTAGDTGTTSGTALDSDLLSRKVVYFSFDSSAIDDDARAVIEAHANHLASKPNIKVRLEGHCDERGTREYNLALGERRAQAVARMMKVLGVPGGQLGTVSYGEEKPVDPGHDDSAWRLNRRVELIY